jgi:hypothetical protein
MKPATIDLTLVFVSQLLAIGIGYCIGRWHQWAIARAAELDRQTTDATWQAQVRAEHAALQQRQELRKQIQRSRRTVFPRQQVSALTPGGAE